MPSAGSGGLGDISGIRSHRTRSVSPENPSGAVGGGGLATTGTGALAARELGVGWKVSPSVILPPGDTAIVDVAGPGILQHLWLTVDPAWWRQLVLRISWNGSAAASVDVPLGDFFANGWCEPSRVSSVPVAVNPRGGFNSYWPMPFADQMRIVLRNLAETASPPVYFQATYAETPDEDPTDGHGYLHAAWRRSAPLRAGELHPILDGVTGTGHYVGTYLAWQSNSRGWWGEGEISFALDGDDHPTILGTGTEDYFGGAWNFESPPGQYGVYSTPYLGLSQVLGAGEGGMYASQQRFGMYRWHVPDPIRFTRDIRVAIQALGWRSEGRYLPLSDDIASTAFYYLREPAPAPSRRVDDRNHLEVI
jgi:hypothetical protein